MANTVITTRTFTDAVLARLQANAEGIDVRDAEGPETPSPSYPYSVLYPLPSPELTDDEGTLSDPNMGRILEWQLTSVGTSRTQAQWCADIMRVALFAAPIVVAGRSLWNINVETLGDIERDDDVDIGGITGSLFSANESFSIPSSPS